MTALATLSVDNGLAELPPGALRLEAGPLEFADPADDGNIPVSILARSAKPIEHWFWGLVVHDLEGVSHKARIPLDYNHDRGDILGYADGFEVSKKGLVLSGALTPVDPSDRATEVSTKAGRGVPYEASIFFSGPLVLEEVGPGATVQVNGYQLKGPALVIRQWTLRGCAVCPYGADSNTQTKFSEAGAERVQVTIHQTEEMSIMFGKRPDDPNADPDRETVKQFVAEFGADQGTAWYTEGKTLHEARELHRQQLAARVADLEEANGEQGASLADLTKERDDLKGQVEKLTGDLEAAGKERDELKARIDAAQLGEEEPASGNPDADAAGKRAKQMEAKLGPIGRIAAGLAVAAPKAPQN